MACADVGKLLCVVMYQGDIQRAASASASASASLATDTTAMEDALSVESVDGKNDQADPEGGTPWHTWYDDTGSINPALWTDAFEAFTRIACKHYGINPVEPLVSTYAIITGLVR